MTTIDEARVCAAHRKRAVKSAIYEERARGRKAQDAVDTLMHMSVVLGTPTPEPDDIDRLDESAWNSLSQIVSRVRQANIRFESPESREAVRRAYRQRTEFRRVQADMTLSEMFDV